MSTTERPRPDFSESEARTIAREQYGLTASARGLSSERDQNFHLKDESGREFVVKISNAAEKKEVLDFQNQALKHLGEQNNSSLYPRVCATTSGEHITGVQSAQGVTYFVRMLTYLPGDFFADVKPHSSGLLRSLGRFWGETDRALADFSHAAMDRGLKWDVRNGCSILKYYLQGVTDPQRSRIVEHFLERFEAKVVPVMPRLRTSVIHNDGNDYNVLVHGAGSADAKVVGVIDFGDMLRTYTVCEPAIAAAYAMLAKEDPVTTAAQVVGGYHEVYPLTEFELEVLYDLLCMRLCMSVAIAAQQQKAEPENEYLKVSERPAWALLSRLVDVSPDLVHYALRHYCKLSPRPKNEGSSTAHMDKEEIMEVRKRHLSGALSVSYKKPLNIVRGFMQYLYDDAGREYLDAVNNVPHVGHCHPRVVEAAVRQTSVLNTNTRYLHENLALYVKRLCAAFPDPLSVCFLVCTGSEANDLALRLARAHTKQTDVIVVDGAYHGNLTSLIELSPYKFDGPGGEGAPAHVHKVVLPDVYRGMYKSSDPEAGKKYARHVREAVVRIKQSGKGVAAFFCEPLPGCAGQIVFPDNYLKEAYRHVRDVGGVCIADEVQIGFGRMGTHFWGFQTQGVVPDIVTLGKPIGNGHPLAAVITTPEIAASFDTGMEYFNTYGGNPVSCAVGLAVLDVVEEEGLQHNALEVGARLKEGLTRLMDKHTLIGDVRGMGLFVGVELVLDRKTLVPAASEASYVIERMKDHGILISVDGPLHNVLKIKPPMVFSEDNADLFVSTLEKVLAEDALKQR